MIKVCTVCGSVGTPKLLKKGSGGIEILLWLCGFLPGLIYTLWRGDWREHCSSCGSCLVIPFDSPASKNILGDKFETIKAEENGARFKIESKEKERVIQDGKTMNFVVVTAVVILLVGFFVITYSTSTPKSFVDPVTTDKVLNDQKPTIKHKKKLDSKEKAASEKALFCKDKLTAQESEYCRSSVLYYDDWQKQNPSQ